MAMLVPKSSPEKLKKRLTPLLTRLISLPQQMEMKLKLMSQLKWPTLPRSSMLGLRHELTLYCTGWGFSF